MRIYARVRWRSGFVQTRQNTVEPPRSFRVLQTAGMAKNKRKRAPKTLLKLPDL
jgi:hypothetical protein